MNDTTILNNQSTRSSLSVSSPYYLAYSDIISGFKNWQLWIYLSWHDVKLNYRRSTIGPLWITISMGITISAMGFLYSKLFKMDLSTYFPFLTTGMLSWSLLSTLMLEGMNTFVDAEGIIKQMKHPYSTFIFRMVSKIFIIFFHNVVILIPISLFFNLKFSYVTLLLPFSLAILWINAVAYSTALSMLSARFRDLKPIVTSIVQIVFFLTPVMWPITLIPDKYRYLVNLNPFAHFISIIRDPLLGHFPSMYSIQFVLLTTIVGSIVSFCIFAKYRARIAYWL